MTSDARRRHPVPESCPPRPRLDGPRRAGPPRAGRPGTAVAEEKRTHWPSRRYLPSAVAAVEAEQRAQNRAGSCDPRRGVAPRDRSVCCRAPVGSLRRSRRGSGLGAPGSGRAGAGPGPAAERLGGATCPRQRGARLSAAGAGGPGPAGSNRETCFGRGASPEPREREVVTARAAETSRCAPLPCRNRFARGPGARAESPSLGRGVRDALPAGRRAQRSRTGGARVGRLKSRQVYCLSR